MNTACLDGLGNMVVRIIWWNWGQNTLKPSIACLKELQDDKIALTLTLIKLQKNVVKAISSLCLFYHVGSINASPALNLKVAVTLFSSGSRPSDKGGEGRGGGIGHLDPEIWRGVPSQKIFSALGTSVWFKNKGPGPSPGSATGIVPDITWQKPFCKQSCMDFYFLSYGSEATTVL